MRFSRFMLGLVLCAVAASGSSGQSDLLSEAGAWSGWSARPEIAPRFLRDKDAGPGVLAIAGGGNPDSCGCWQRDLPALEKDRRFRIEAEFQTETVDAPAYSVWAFLTHRGRFYGELDYTGRDGEWSRMSVTVRPEEDLDNLSLRLCLAWSPKGVVRWSGARLSDVTDTPVRPRLARLAAISGKPRKPASPTECIDFYCDRLDEIGRRGVDLVTLGETINIDGLSGDQRGFAEPIPGPSTRRFAEKARQYKMYVVASLHERDGPRIYNTSVLIGRSGTLVGIYRKTHPTISESFLSGRRPGDDYPVFDTDFGRIGMMICYDNHFPEVARLLAVKGAEIIAFSNMGDGREGGSLWEPYIRTRALDNQVHIVAAVNQGRSLIVSPRGEILDKVDRTPGAIATATCDLDATVRDFTGRQIGRRYLRLRRADTFDVFSRHSWEFKQ